MDPATMDREALLAWAHHHGDGPFVDTADFRQSISSKLLRFRWNDAAAIAVGADADGKTRINAVLDAVAMFLADPGAGSVVHLLVGTSCEPVASMKEHFDAISTLVAGLADGPDVRVWTLTPGGAPIEFDVAVPRFTTGTPGSWTKLLTKAAAVPVTGMAAKVAAALAGRPSFALYPKLSSLDSPRPWQMRLDGLEIGRTGEFSTTLALASQDLTKPAEPRLTWLATVGEKPLTFTADQTGELVALIDKLINAWTNKTTPAAVLGHGQAEHALEAHILSGRTILRTQAGPLRPAIPVLHGTLAAAQFPTLWGDVSRPARYLDALLADELGRPWAVELKDQAAGGGHGAYLRHGIGQAVLYRHYIRAARELATWFGPLELDPEQCQAALAFPTASTSAAHTIGRLSELASLYDVEIIEFPRPS